MATRYFKNSVDQNWDTLGNWWSDAAFTEGFSGTLTGVTVTDTDATVTCDSTAGLVVGRPITGTGIDTGSTVASITNGTEFELSLPAIANGSSNLTCELHVIPVTADDVVIATGNGTVAGTPSADVLGLVTVNGDSVLSVTLEAASFEFNDTSSNAGTITGNCTLTSSSWVASNTGTIFGDCVFNTGFNHSTGTITGVCEFNSNSSNAGTITGNCTFNGSSNDATVTGNCEFNGSSGQYGTIIGNCEFNDTSNNYTNGDITGDCTFEDSSYNDGNITGNCTFNSIAWVPANTSTGTIIGNCDFSVGRNVGSVTGDCNFTGAASSNGTITGNATFASGCYNDEGGTVTEDATFNGSGGNDGAVTGNATFNDTSSNLSGATVGGNATFTNTAYSTALTGFFNPQQGTVSGTVDFPNGATFTLETGESWSADASAWTGTLAWVFNGTSYNAASITAATVTFNDTSYNSYTISATTVTFNDYAYNRCPTDHRITATTIEFNDNSFNGLSNVSGGYITGDCWFYNSSFNEYNGNITGNATFPESEYSTPQGYGFGPQLGSVSGTVTFTSLTPVKFTLADAEFWGADTTGWVFDTAGQNWEFNNSSFNDTTSNITGDFEWYSSNYNYGTINGNCVGGAIANNATGTINGNGAVLYNNGTINGDCSFTGNAYTGSLSNITGNCTFDTHPLYGGTSGGGTITGDCVFNGVSAHTSGNIYGNATFNDSSVCSSYASTATFNDFSQFNSNLTWTGSTFEFNDYSYSTGNGTLSFNCTFNDSSHNSIATINGNASFTNTAFSTATTGFVNPQQGSVWGTVDFPNGATFTLANYEAWTVNASAWTGTLAWVFNGNSNNASSSTITGNPTFNDSSYNASGGTITGNPTFNDTSYNAYNGHITGNPTFNGTSNNGGTITGNATFYDDSYNTANVITGNAIIRQHAAAFVAWRNYATSTHITGTLTLQFPEMDVLGTGLL